MESYAKAKCECEKESCEWAWNSQDRLGLTTDQFVSYGKYVKGVLPGKPCKRVLQPTYVVDTNAIHDYFPNTHLMVSPYAMTHDHPVSHTVTEYVRRQMYDSLPRGTVDAPKRYLDLHGSPSVNISYNRSNRGIVIESFVEIKTAKDHLRAKNWPSHPSVYRNWGRVDLSTFDGFLGTHTSYYYDSEFYLKLAKAAPDATFHFIVHRFESPTGVLNGELKYEKFMKIKGQNSAIWVRQTNKLGSDAYEHLDNDTWFNQGSRNLGTVGLSWSTNQVCPGTWVIKGCFCPTADVVTLTTLAVVDNKSSDYFVSQGTVSCVIGGQNLSCSIEVGEQQQFFDLMRSWITTKARTPERFRDYVSRYKSFLDGPRKKFHGISGRQAYKLGLAAFFIDSKDEASVLPVLFEATKEETKMLSDLTPQEPYMLNRLLGMPQKVRQYFSLFEPYRQNGVVEMGKTHSLPRYEEVE
jgi:hypothetical protein